MLYTGNKYVDSKAMFMQVRNEYIKSKGLKPNLIFFGDSITEGFSPLNYGLVTDGILNCGIGGERLDTAMARVDRDVLQFRPDAVHIMLGINDLLHYPQIQKHHIENKIEQLLNLYIDIIDVVLTVDCIIYIGSVIKLAEIPYDEQNHEFTNYMYYNEIIERLNTKLEDYCKLHSIQFIDYNCKLTNKYNQLNVSYTTDGIHLNEKGYFEMFKAMKSAGVL
ncbi:GDSL-type esterase/lipase family protein [Mollicutes bacterium LVI A0039]|nr:GDSL-type esterase/lipase family protein [Mollicutes bacterium LVI A0039]